MKRILTIAAAMCCLISESGAETPLTPDPAVPSSWEYQPVVQTVAPADDGWWEIFGDKDLVGLIRQAEENAPDIKMALRRINMARQSWNAAKSGWYPTLGLSAGWTKERQSGDVAQAGGRAVDMSYFSLGLDFNWEIDVFGRVASQVREGKAAYNATRAEYDGAMISLAANVATAYTNLLLSQAQIQLAEEQIASQERIHAITVARHECGLASKLDVAQSLTVLYNTRSTLPTLRSQEVSALNNLAMLTGCYPDKIAWLKERKVKLPNPYVMTQTGVPANLLRRRPDIIAAECRVAQYAAALGAARKDFLPVLELTGSVGTSAHNVKDLFTDNSFSYTIAPRLSWTVFEGLARKYRVAEAKEQMMLEIDIYNQTVMNAVIETDDALASYTYSLERIGLTQKVCDESHEALELALDRYKKGLSAFTDVMNAQVSLLENLNTLLQCKAAALTSAIRIYQCVAGNPAK